jgi:hypothetical protein
MSYSSHPAVRELDAVLQSLPALKPPGVNKAKVEASTKICMDPQNVSVRTGSELVVDKPNIRS